MAASASTVLLVADRQLGRVCTCMRWLQLPEDSRTQVRVGHERQTDIQSEKDPEMKKRKQVALATHLKAVVPGTREVVHALWDARPRRAVKGDWKVVRFAFDFLGKASEALVSHFLRAR